MTYIGSLVVGIASFITKDYSWGILVPFMTPFIVQACIRITVEYEYQKTFMTNRDVNLMEGPEFFLLDDLSSYSTYFNSWKRNNSPHLLIKIHINHSPEVIRLSEEDGLAAERRMITMLEVIIQQSFSDGMIVKTSFNEYLIALPGRYEELENRIHMFTDEHGTSKIAINNIGYYPKFIMGLTPFNDDVGDSFSRLELAIKKASISSGRTSWFVACDSDEFSEYRRKRIGMRVVRRALDDFQLGLYAQPIIALHGARKIHKYEILLRHYQSETDIKSPFEILQYADFNGISQDVDLYVIRLLCQNFHKVCNNDVIPVESISINITGSSFVSPKFAKLMMDIVELYEVPKEKIILEVTEDIASKDVLEAIKTMEIFRASGYQMALDDIGIGSSNFRNLNKFPVDYFKIDRSYCEDILHSTEIRRFVQLIIDIGKSGGRKIIAEGIPDLETLDLLREMGVDYSQSFITGMPKECIIAPAYDKLYIDQLRIEEN